MSHISAPPARDVAVSLSSQLVGKVAHIGLSLAVSLSVIRYLGPSGYGEFSYVLAMAGLLGLLADFGLSKLAVREVVRRDAGEGAVLGTVIVTRVVLGAGAAGIGQLALFALGATPAVRAAAAVLSVVFVTEAVLTVVVMFQVRLHQQYEALVRTTIKLLELVFVLVCIAVEAALVTMMVGLTVASAVGAVLAVVLARRRYGLHLSVDAGLARYLLRQALSAGPATIIGAAFLRVDIVVLGALRPAEDVGIYGAAFQPIEYLLLSTAVIVGVLLPLLSRYHGTDHERFEAVYRRGTESMVAATVPVVIVVWFLGPELVGLLYGDGLAAIVEPMRVLTVCLVLMSVNVWQSFVLLAGGRQAMTLAYDAPALAMNVGLDLVLIPWLAYNGPGYATLLSSVFVTACSTAATRRCLGARLDYRQLGRVLQANVLLAAGLAALLVARVPWPLAIVLAAPIYALSLQARGVLDLRELRRAMHDRGGPAAAARAVEPVGPALVVEP